MADSRNILPECYADTLLVEVLGFKKANHQFSIGQVFKIMEDKMATRLAVGVTDKDKKITAKYYAAFQEQTMEHGVRILKIPDKKHYLIEHIPLEKFLFQAAENVDVDPARYGFSSIRALSKITKSHKIDKNQQFRQFLNTLLQKETPSFMFIQRKLRQLVGEIY